MSAQEQLALFGGPKAVTSAQTFRWPLIGEEEIQAVLALMRKGELSYYSREGVLKEFEDRFAAYHDGIPFAIAVNSGTSALHSAFFGVGVGPGDEVIAPTYTFLATVTPILQSNGIPVLCDCEPDTHNIDPARIREAITERTKAIVITHQYGHPCEMDEITALAREHGLAVIEDCSLAHGAVYKGRKVGTIGDVGVFSLQDAKIIAAGQGGILITRNEQIHDRATLLGHFRLRAEEWICSDKYRPFASTGYGANMRMHPLAAAIANEQLKKADDFIRARKKNLEHLSRVLAQFPGIEPPVTRPGMDRGSFGGYKPLYHEEELQGLPRDIYVKALQAEGVHIKPIGRGHTPLHLLPLFQVEDHFMYSHGCPQGCPHAGKRYRYQRGDFPVSEKVFASALNMPTYTEDSRELIDQFELAFAKVTAQADLLRSRIDEIRARP